MKTSLPESNDVLRQEIYSGQIFKVPAGDNSVRLIEKINSLLEEEFKAVDLRKIHEALDYGQMTRRISHIRRMLADDAGYHNDLRALVNQYGFKPENNMVDPFRLRCIYHDGHLSRGSERAYALHRDTWFCNPQSQVNWWIPLHDVTEEDSFAFYPDYFNVPVPNTSSRFDFAAWMEAVGWQGIKGGTYAEYPVVENAFLLNPGKSFSAKAGDILLFSGSHLHGTCRNGTGFTRWSLDFRTVHMADFEGQMGAPNVDNGSLPLATSGYIRPSS